MKTLWVASLFLALLGCGSPTPGYVPKTLKLVTAARDLPAGAVIKASDLTITERKIDIADNESTEDPSKVIGHTTRFETKKGEIISLWRISP